MRNCPGCESDQFKKARLVYDEGHSKTLAAGVGVGTGGAGVGVGKGVTISALAEKCSPPVKAEPPPFGDAKMWQFLVVAVPVVIAFAGGGEFNAASYFWMAWGIAGAIFLFSKSHKATLVAEENYRLAMAVYEKTYLCTRCGTLFKPFD